MSDIYDNDYQIHSYNQKAGCVMKNNFFKGLGIGKQIAAGFGLVLIILIGVAGWGILGIGNIVDNATEVIDGNKIRVEIEQKNVYHLH